MQKNKIDTIPPGGQFSGHSQLFVDAQQVARFPLGHIIMPQSRQSGLITGIKK